MATQFTRDCPHCHTRRAGFVVAFQWASREMDSKHNFLAICGVCNLGITITSYDSSSSSHASLLNKMYEYPGNRFRITKISPSPSINELFGVPDNIKNYYRQGEENLAARRWDAAGAMFRKTLDVSTKALSQTDRKLDLFKRINRLVEQGLLTTAMGDWSHEIRIDGNDAIHDEEPETEADARSIQRFSEAFLTYVFSLPHLVKRSREKRDTVETAD